MLLDGMATPEVACSTRKLRTAYSGQCLRVRRSSDNTEQDIGFVGGKLDTAALLTFVGAGDGFVVTWYDQSGNARNATQATAAKQMYIAQSGATIPWGASGDVALLNPAENRLLTYVNGGVGPAIPRSALWAFRSLGGGAVGWNLGSNGPHWYDSALFDTTGSANATANGLARVFLASYAAGNKRLRHSGGTATNSSGLGYTVEPGGSIGNYSDGYPSPLNALHHSCIVWNEALADIDTPFAAVEAWL